MRMRTTRHGVWRCAAEAVLRCACETTVPGRTGVHRGRAISLAGVWGWTVAYCAAVMRPAR